MTYLLDANVFIQAKNRHYGFDFCPAFWEWLEIQNTAKKVASIEKVADELKSGDDDLSNWAQDMGHAFFLPADDAVLLEAKKVSAWANNQGYEQAAVTTFLGVADYWLVSHALAHRCTVVTHEVFAESVKKIKIPNACNAFEVDCITPYEMLRREKAKFVLGKRN